MTGARWARVESLFHRALELPRDRRQEFLRRRAGDDPELLTEVSSLLGSEENPHRWLAFGDSEGPDLVLPKASDMDLGGRRIGPYTVHEELGRGGMSRVYRATREDEGHARELALKVIRQSLFPRPLLRRFRAEKEILARLDHPNIARLFDGGTAAGLPYFVMELVDGPRLDTYCSRQGLSVRERLQLFRQVCDAVSYAHGALVVHRDIKPSNILVASDGTPKLLDFGIAKLLLPEGEELGRSTTQTWLRLMTPGYASPEQLQGGAITTASDIYSLGVVLYELLTDRLPQDPRALARLAPGAEPPEPRRPSALVAARGREGRRLCRELSGDLDSIVAKALAWDPPSRYGSAGELAADLDLYLEGRPVKARRSSPGQRLAKFVRRNRMAVGIGTGLVAMTLAAAILLGLFTVQLAKEKERIESEKEKAEEVAEFLTELFAVADDSGDHVAARELLEKGAERIAGELSLGPLERAELFDTLATAYRNLGLYRQARPILESVLETRLKSLGEEHVEVALSRYSLGQVLHDLALYAEGDRLLRQALAAQESLGDTLGAARTLGQLSWGVGVTGNLAEADRLQRRSLELLRRELGPDHREVAEALNNLGVLYMEQRKEEAEDLFREAVEMDRRLPGPPQRGSAMYSRNLAAFLMNRGELEEAESLYREALALELELFGEEHPAIAGSYQKLGQLLHKKGELEAAEESLSKALAMRRKLMGREHPRAAWTLLSLARLYGDMERSEEAAELFEESAALLRRAMPVSHLTASALGGWGGFLLAEGDPAAAEPLLREALEMGRRTLPEGAAPIADMEDALRRCRAALAGPTVTGPR